MGKTANPSPLHERLHAAAVEVDKSVPSLPTQQAKDGAEKLAELLHEAGFALAGSPHAELRKLKDENRSRASDELGGKLDKHQAAVIGAYTGVLSGPFEEMHEYITRVMGRPVFTHELADAEFVGKLKAKSKPDFLALVRS